MLPELVATYRVQLTPDFGFHQAAEVVAYLAHLGISHLYTSPSLQAVAGSTHGYDVVDPTQVNEELGGAEAHARLCRTLQSAGLGQVIDVVPNHMAVVGRENDWWWDVLQNGPSSRFARYFDIDWQASPARWPDRILLPVLGDHYGRVLSAGQLQLVHQEGLFDLQYHEHCFPVRPSSLSDVLDQAAEASGSALLGLIAKSVARLPRCPAGGQSAIKRHRQKEAIFALLRDLCRKAPETVVAIDAQVERLNRDTAALDRFVSSQHYRLAFWRMAATDLGYRRFFDIKDLAGVRVEDPEVFAATHALPITWVQKGWVQGLRVDHPDGLWDPAAYFRKLRAACPGTWIVAEKILEAGEALPSDWPVAGTTGYDFLNLAGGLFIDPAGEIALSRLYEDFTGEKTVFHDLVLSCKRLVLEHLFASELNRLTRLLVAICERHPRHRDYTTRDLGAVLGETAACFPVYRSYVATSEKRVGSVDERYVSEAIAKAQGQRADLPPDLFQFLLDLLLLRVPGEMEGEFAMRYQQLTGPAMAKGMEDTAFYRFHRLIALNEVGGDPSRFGISPDRFHRTCMQAQAERPQSMLASTTHDTKRSEDVRARLALLSEIPQKWAEAVNRWKAHNQQHGTDGIPDGNAEYLLYQTLVGAWPIDCERITAYMQKAVREAKQHTSWIDPNEAYEQGLRDFISAILADRTFCADLERFVAPLVPAGRINSLAQTLIKMTAPGVPDIYQGTELWDLSLVDPDNRRSVDYGLRRRLLAELARMAPEAIMAKMETGLPKLWVVRQALRLRRRWPKVFGPEGYYQPLQARGPKANHVVAFMRGKSVISLVPRLIVGHDDSWEDTELGLPQGHWRNSLTGEDMVGGALRVKVLLKRFPVALLRRKANDDG